MITVIVNNCNLLTWPREMVEKIKTLEDVGDIIMVDNGSTYPPLLEWYDSERDIKVLKGPNRGHTAPWSPGVMAQVSTPFYVVTDPDMGIQDIPKDTLRFLKEGILLGGFQKAGLGLAWWTVPVDSPLYDHVNSYERSLWTVEKHNGLFCAPVDTTFALYCKKIRSEYFIGGGRADRPYFARHYPWEMTDKERNESEEFQYYLRRANSSSCMKKFLESRWRHSSNYDPLPWPQ